MVDDHRLVADNKIKRLALDKCGGLFLHLVLGQMGKQIRDEENRVVLLFAYIDQNSLSALFDHNAVDSEGQGDILILFDASVIMGIQVAEAAVLIDGILFDIQAGRIDVRAQDVDPLLKRLFSDPEQDHGFVHPDTVDTVAGLELFLFRDGAAQLYISVLFRFRDKKVHALAFCLADVQEVHILFCKLHAFFLHREVIGVPCIKSFHLYSFSPILLAYLV